MRRFKHRSRLPRPACQSTVDPGADRLNPSPPQPITPAETQPAKVASGGAVQGGVSITLTTPITFDGVTHSVITVRPPTDQDIRRVSARNHNRFARGVALTAILTGWRPAMVLKMSKADARKVDDLLSGHTD